VSAEQYWYVVTGAVLTLVILVVNGFSIRSRLLRDRMAHNLNVQNLRFNALLSDMPLGVCMFDGDGRLAISNDRYAQMYDLPAEAMAPGTSLHEIVGRRKACGTLSGDVDDFCEDLIERLGRELLVRNLSHLSDGRVISSLHQPMEGGGWVSIHEDITEQELAKARLEQTKRFLDTIIENVPAPIVVKEPDTLKISLVNQAFERFIGVPRENLIGKTVFEFYPPNDAALIAKYDGEAIRSDKRLISAEFLVQTPANGPRALTTTRLVVRDGTDRPQYLIVVFDDVTERKKAEAKIAHMAHHDPLTGLLNRTRFTEQLDDGLTRIRHGEELAVLFLDLDQFKEVNDTLGHSWVTSCSRSLPTACAAASARRIWWLGWVVTNSR
jgi:PAS domain S-box-containing protein